jgi:hypothetical protein
MLTNVKINRAQETSTSSGTGYLTLLGPTLRRKPLALGSAEAWVLIEHMTEPEWEICIATRSGDLLVRGTVEDSSNGGARVNFSAGVKLITLTQPANRGLVRNSEGRLDLAAADIRQTLNWLPANQPLPLPTGAGVFGGTTGIGKAVVVSDDGNYNHFTRGKGLRDGRTAIGHVKSNNHGGGDDDALFTLQQILAAGTLTLDGQIGGGGTTATMSPAQQLKFRFYANETARTFTLTGNASIGGVSTPTTEYVTGVNVGTVLSTNSWLTVSIACDGATAGNVSIGTREAPGNVMFRMSRNGAQTTYNDKAIVDGLTSGDRRGYQVGLAYTEDNEFVYIAYEGITGVGDSTGRWINNADGDPDGWTQSDPVLFGYEGDTPAATVNGGRPIFFTEIFTRPGGQLFTLLQSDRYIWTATSDDKGQTWTVADFVVMARTNCDLLAITASSISGKTFKVAGDVTAKLPVGCRKQIWNSTASVHNGVYTITARSYSAGETTITVSETVNSDTPSGYLNMSGVVAVNTGTKTYTFGGSEHLSALAVGQTFCLNNSVANDKLWTIAALAANGQDTDVTVVETIDSSSVSGRIQNANIGEIGLAFVDDLTFICVARLVNGGSAMADQFVSTDGGATKATYVGRPTNPVSGSGVSHFLMVSRIAGRVIVKWYYHWRSNTGNAYSICYRTGDAYALLRSANAWMPEKCIVSTTTPLLVEGVGNVYASGTYKRHGYPFAVSNPSGDTDTVYFTLETSNTTAVLYAVTVRPELQQYFGGRILLDAATVAGSSDTYECKVDLDAFSDIEVVGSLNANAAGLFGVRVSEDRSTFYTTNYLSRGSSGTATSYMPMHNVSVGSGTDTDVQARIEHCNDSTRATKLYGRGGVNNSSTSGGTTISKRNAAGVLKRLSVIHTGGGLMTGTIEIYGRVAPVAA